MRFTPIDVEDEYIETYNELLKEGYNILDLKDKFYNYLCTPYTSKSNTDMILYDRKITFFDSNLTYCEQGCTHKRTDMDQKKFNANAQ